MNTNRLSHIAPLEHAHYVGEMLANFLNAAKGLAKQREVVEIFHLCRQLDELRRKKPPFPLPKQPTQEVTEYLSQYYMLTKRLNNALEKYRFRPVLAGHDPYRIDWFVAKPGKPSKREIKQAEASGTVPLPSISAINIILEMTANGTLDRVRECICGRWFFAATNKKVVCSDACRFEKYKQKDKDAFKKQRADYMRDYYRNPKAKTKRRKPQ